MKALKRQYARASGVKTAASHFSAKGRELRVFSVRPFLAFLVLVLPKLPPPEKDVPRVFVLMACQVSEEETEHCGTRILRFSRQTSFVFLFLGPPRSFPGCLSSLATCRILLSPLVCKYLKF